MLDQVIRNPAHLGFVLAQSLLGTSTASLAKFLSFGLVIGGPILAENSAHFPAVELPWLFATWRFVNLLRLKSGEPVGNLLKRFKVRNGGDVRMAAFRLKVEVEASHSHTKRMRNDSMSCLMQGGSQHVFKVPSQASHRAARVSDEIQNALSDSKGCQYSVSVERSRATVPTIRRQTAGPVQRQEARAPE
jgi:hypothetical protein